MIAVAIGLGVVAILISAIVLVSVVDLVRRPSFRRLASRNAVRHKNEASLVLLGSLLGTAIVTSAFVVGDTLNASIRDEARTRLGPIDEVVLVHHSTALPALLDKITSRPLPDTDGITTLVTAPATVTNGDSGVAEPKAFVHELDFDAARRFGGHPSDTGLADAGPTPNGTEAVIGRDLADDLRAGVGDSVKLFLYGNVTAFTVRGIVPRVGLAGFHPTHTELALDVFVPPGTLDALAAAAPTDAQPPEGRVLVSNAGGVFGGVGESDAVSLELQIRTAGLTGVEVASEKQATLDFAERQGATFTELFGLIGGFIVVAGVLLLVNVFVMLAEERKSELGTLRALGLKRNHLVRIFGLEGNLYSVTAAAIGALVGIGVGRVLVGATERVFGRGDRHTTLQFAVRPASIAIGFVIGLAISLLTVWGTSLRIGFLNVIRAIRDVPEPPRRQRPWRTLVLGSAGVIVGGQLFAVGVTGESAMLALAGPALALWSSIPLLSRFTSRRVAVALPCSFLLVYTTGAFSLLPSAPARPGVEVFFVQGLVLVFTAVALVITNDDQFRRLVDRLGRSGGGVATRLGLAHPLAKRLRTALLVGMYALIVFVLVFMTVFAAVFEAQGPQLANDTSAGYDLVVASNPTNPVTADDLARVRDVVGTAPLVDALAKFETPAVHDSFQRHFTGFDESLLTRGAPALSSRDRRYPTDVAAWRAVLASSDLVIVPSDFFSRGGPPRSSIAVGDRITLIDPAGGRRHDLTVAGIDGDIDAGDNGAMVGAAAIPTFVDRSSVGRFYVARRDGADEGVVAAELQRELIANGVSAETFRALVDDRLSGTTSFIRLLQGFLALGLVIGLAGLGVVMVRAVRERRREIGMLRAMGFRARIVRRAFVVEAAFIALQGIVIGATLGVVTGFSVLSNSSTFGDKRLPFTVPWPTIGLLVLAALAASFVAVAVPAAQASRVKPAIALRIAD